MQLFLSTSKNVVFIKLYLLSFKSGKIWEIFFGMAYFKVDGWERNLGIFMLITRDLQHKLETIELLLWRLHTGGKVAVTPR